MDVIHPAVRLSNGRTVYPTGLEWLLGFAIGGCKWAQDALPGAIEVYKQDEIEKHFGENI
ncbi:MAG: hypothetical protein WC919_05480 [Candidatus Paceibacterota bacterium]|jgi:hypothetical protein